MNWIGFVKAWCAYRPQLQTVKPPSDGLTRRGSGDDAQRSPPIARLEHNDLEPARPCSAGFRGLSVCRVECELWKTPPAERHHLKWNWWRPVAQRPLPIARLEERDREIISGTPLDLKNLVAALSDHNTRKLVRTGVGSKGLHHFHIKPVLLEYAEMLLLAVIVQHAFDLRRAKYPICEAAQLLRSLQSRFAFGFIQNRRLSLVDDHVGQNCLAPLELVGAIAVIPVEDPQ